MTMQELFATQYVLATIFLLMLGIAAAVVIVMNGGRHDD